MMKHLKYLFLTIIFILIQTQILQLISLEGIAPDILIIWIVYIAVKEGQLFATVWGFIIGLVFDLSIGGFIGISALSKTIAGFTAGYFFRENKTEFLLSSYRFVLIVLISSLVSNTIYFLIFTRGSEINLLHAVFLIGIATTVYTSAFSILPMFTFARKYSKLHV
jgi:rod shape-determining protein MreD